MFLRKLSYRLQFKYKIPEIQTASIRQTAKVVNEIYLLLAENPLYFAETPDEDAKISQQVVAMTGNFAARRKDNVKPAVSMLMGIPGVSLVKATAILAQVDGSIEGLCKKPVDEIAKWQVGKIKVGPKLAGLIFTALHGSKETQALKE